MRHEQSRVCPTTKMTEADTCILRLKPLSRSKSHSSIFLAIHFHIFIYLAALEALPAEYWIFRLCVAATAAAGHAAAPPASAPPPPCAPAPPPYLSLPALLQPPRTPPPRPQRPTPVSTAAQAALRLMPAPSRPAREGHSRPQVCGQRKRGQHVTQVTGGSER